MSSLLVRGSSFIAALLAVPLVVGASPLLAACSGADDASTVLGDDARCYTAADCPGGSCIEGVCAARSAPYTRLLLQVDVPASSASNLGRGRRFLQMASLTALQRGEGVLIPPPSRIRGTVELPKRTDCSGYDPATSVGSVTAASAWRLNGVQPSFEEARFSCGTPCTALTFELELPDGRWDLAVQPDGAAPPPGACELVPAVFRGAAFTDANVSYTLRADVPAELPLVVRLPVGTTFGTAPWQLDLLDPKLGRRLSTIASFNDASADPTQLAATVRFGSPGGKPALEPGTELVRLTPPDGALAPTVYVERSALGLFEGAAVLEPFKQLTKAVVVHGRVERASDAAAADAVVSFAATALDGVADGVLASFTQTATTDAEGRFRTELLPGDYRVLVAPTLPLGLAQREEQWTIAAEPALQGGKVLGLEPARRIEGFGFEVSGAPRVGTVTATPVGAKVGSGVLARLFGGGSATARVASAELGAEGFFSVLVDPAKYDLLVRPASGSAEPWYVDIDVDATSDLLGQGLRPPSPLSVTGQLRVGGELADGAVLTAFVIVGEKGGFSSSWEDTVNPPLRAVRIAEARADSEARFLLALPSQIR